MDDPWFITYRGRYKLQIVPIAARGWVALALVTLLSVVPMLLATPFIKQSPAMLAVPLLALVAIWVPFIRWAIAKSEIIDLDAMLAERRARDAKRRPNGRKQR